MEVVTKLGKFRQLCLILAFFAGILAVFGSALFAVAGAGMYGSPFAGDPYFNTTLLLVLIGPVAILPCAILDYLKPGGGGIILSGLAILEIIPISLNNIYQWGFAIHNAALAILFLALPMFSIGVLLVFSSKSFRSGLD